MKFRLEVFNALDEFLGTLPHETVEIGEYEKYPLRFTLADQPADTFELRIDDQVLERKRENFYFGSRKENERGRPGDVEVQIYHKNRQIAVGYLMITPGNLSKTQYRYLIRDLKKHLIRLVSTDPTVVRGIEVEKVDFFIELYDQRLCQIGTFLEQFTGHLNGVEQTPHRTIIKRYHLEQEDKVRRIDTRTIRWRIIHGTQVHGKALTYTNVESYDVYENQFLVYILDRLQRYLSDLLHNFSHEINQEIQEVVHHFNDLENYGEIADEEDGTEARRKFKAEQLRELRHVCAKLTAIKQKKETHYKKETHDFQMQINQLRRRPFLAEVKPSSAFPVKPTLVLLRHPEYHAIWNAYRKIEEDLQLDERQRIGNLLDRVPIERTSKLYEYWVFLQVYEGLKRVGFEDAQGSQGIWNLIDRRSFRLRSGRSLNLVGDPKIYGDGYGNTFKVRLYYECRFSQFCPDVLIKFAQGKLQKTLILDAKYRKYDNPDCPPYDKDVEDTAHHKYKLLERWSTNDQQWVTVEEVKENVRDVIAASFIVHSDPSRLPDYGSASHRNEYGAIPLVPEEPHLKPANLKLLLTMFMRMHLRLLDICWLHDPPLKAKPVRELGGQHRKLREWEYHCPKCDNRWWVNHCGHCGEKDRVNRMKITFSDDSDNFFDPDDERKIGEKQLFKCSYCNKSFRRGE